MNTDIIITIVLTAGLSVGLPLLFDFLKSKGVNVEQAIEGIEEGANAVELVASALSTVSGVPVAIVTKICDAIKTAAATAEANYQTAKSTNPAVVDTRKVTVTTQVQSLLTMSGIKVTPEINKVISTAIDTLVLGLHKDNSATVSTASGTVTAVNAAK